jgi:Icc-related predicted phosphoesterase
MPLRIVCISDTHGLHRELSVPSGDLLIHAGDLTRRGELDELRDLNDWLGSLPHPHKVVIAGNHDWCCQQEPEHAAALLTHATYLQDAELVVAGLRLYGSPWTHGFGGWAFTRSPTALAYHWAELPDGLDLLLTHGPPLGAQDQNLKGEHLGDPALAEAVRRVRPRLHIFGHIHEGYGLTAAGGTAFVNASVCTAVYEPIQGPIVVEL